MIILISKNIDVNRENLIKLFNNTADLELYEFESLSGDRVLIGFINGIIDEPSLNEHLIKPLMKDLLSPWEIKSTIYMASPREISKLQDSVNPISNGHVILFIEDMDLAYLFDLGQWAQRSVEQPTSERVIRGPKEAFIECVIVNKTLIRRIIMNNDLVFEEYILGQQTNTRVYLAYIKGIVRAEILDELRSKIKKIDIDAVLDNDYIEEYIENKPKNLIATVGFTERPDVAASKILAGGICILCDGAPNALTVPKLFIEDFHSAEDYYIRPKYATFLRLLRVLGFLISITLPGVYIALIFFHQEMIPTNLLISIAGQREGVPFASTLEAFLLVMFFELLKESSLRLPKAIGETVTLVGGLVIGQAAVDEGVVSATMVIIVAATGVSEFIVAKMREVIPIYRLIFLFLGSLLGLYGVSFGMVFLIIHLISAESFGVPYMWPIAPLDKEGIKDSLIRPHLRHMNYRL